MIKLTLSKTAALALAAVITLTPVSSALANSADPTSLATDTSIITDQVKVQLVEAEVKQFAEQFFSESNLKAWGIPGATLSVVQGNSIVYQQGFGVADIANNTSVDSKQTIFRTGSVAKLITATALMQLVEQGKVSLNAGVNDYLPEPWVEYPDGNPVTIAHLLTHTTGFANVMDIRPGDIYTNLDEYYDLESYIKESVPGTVRQPGETFKYDNFASALQGYIVENVSKQSFEDYVQQHIFKPLGMHSSGFRTTSTAAEQMATGYMPDMQPYPAYGVKPSDLPQGGWYTTAEDAAIFMLAHLNKGTYNGKQILSAETAELMQQYQVYIQPDVPVMAYGFEASMFTNYDQGQRVLFKGGDILGFSSLMWLLPEHEIGVFLSTNVNSGVRELLYQQFMEKFIPDISTPKTPLHTAVEKLKAFEGSYMDLRTEGWKSTITAAGAGKLQMVDTLLGTIQFTQVGPMTFIDHAGVELVFKQDEYGVPQYFKYKNIGYSQRLEINSYQDVPADSIYAPAINNLVTYNLFKEDTETFRPDETITRAEFVAYFMRLLKLPPSSAATLFSDMKDHPLSQEVQAAAELGLTNGLPNGYFMPDQGMTRQEAAVIIYRLMQLQGVGQVPPVPLKEQPSPWASDAVNMMITAGFIGPEITVDEDGLWNYKPHDKLLRKEAAAMLDKIVQMPQQAQ